MVPLDGGKSQRSQGGGGRAQRAQSMGGALGPAHALVLRVWGALGPPRPAKRRRPPAHPNGDLLPPRQHASVGPTAVARRRPGRPRRSNGGRRRLAAGGGPALSGRFAPSRRSSQRSLCVAAKAASFNFLAHWASASLYSPLAALGSPSRRGFHQRQKDPKKRLPQTKRAAPDERRASIIRRKTGKVFQLVFPRFFKSGWGSGGKAPGKIQRYPQRPYAVSISKAASRRHTQNTSRAASSSATGGRLGAMRILLSWGSLP